MSTFLLLVAGCGTPDAASPEARRAGQGTEPAPETTPGPDGGDAAAAGAGLAAVATVFPLAWIAGEVAPGADQTLLGARGQDPHDLELTPGDRALLEGADVVLAMGELGFQPHVEAALDERDGPTVSVREVAGEAALLPLAGRGEDDHDDEDHGDDRGDDDHGDERRHDPHLWFDPDVMAEVALAAGEAFAGADPGGAATYRANARAVHDELTALGDDLDALLGDCAHDTAIVSHEAYAYLLAPRGLGQDGISGAGGHGEASPQRLAALVEHVRAEGVPAVLAEPVEGRADAEALAREAGVPLLEIDPLETAGDEAFATGYPALLREQGEAFAEALGCG